MRVLKNPAFSALAHMNIRGRGRAKVGLFVAFAAAISNLRAADRWRAGISAPRDRRTALGRLLRQLSTRFRTQDAESPPSVTRCGPSVVATGDLGGHRAEPPVRIELTTFSLRVRRSTD